MGKKWYRHTARIWKAAIVCPVSVFAGFARVALKAGESVQVTIPVEGRSFQLVDEDGNRIVEPGKFRIYIGGSLPDERSSQLNGTTPLQAEVVVCGWKKRQYHAFGM